MNQDRILARQGETGGHWAGLFLVADGCGGMAYGEKISQLLADSFAAIWESELPEALREGKAVPELVVGWTEQINAVAFSFGKQVQQQVGSTLSLLVLVDSDYYIFNTGDSRVYLRRNGRVLRMTEDQTLIADKLRNQEITPEEAAQIEGQNALTMCVGYFPQVRIFRRWGRLHRGDVLLLCSDGLYRGLGEAELLVRIPHRVLPDSALRLRESISPGAAADNVSAVLVEIL